MKTTPRETLKHPPANHTGDLLSNPRILFGWGAQSVATPPRRIGFQASAEPARAANSMEPLRLEAEHCMVISPTGSGKGRGVLIPHLLELENPCVILDPKGEAVRITRRRREAMGHRVVVIDPFRMVSSAGGDGLNPLDVYLRFDRSDTFDLAASLTELIRGGTPSFEKDPFWSRSSGALLTAVIACIAENPDPEQRNLNILINKYFASDFDHTLAVLLDSGVVKPRAYAAIANYLSMPDATTRPSVRATAVAETAFLASQAVEQTIQKTTFDIDAFRRGEALDIFIVIPPNKLSSHGGLLRLLLGTLMNVIISRTCAPKAKTIMLIDETAQIGHMSQILEAMTLLRGYGLLLHTFWQDASQLKNMYPTTWQTILNNCSILQVFGINNGLAARELSDILGVDSRLLAELPRDRQLILSGGTDIHISRRLDYLRDPCYSTQWDGNPMFTPSAGSAIEAWNMPAVRRGS